MNDLQIDQIFEGLQYRIDRVPPSVFAEKHRVMTTDVSPFPGKFSFKRTPYFREILDRMRPEDPAETVTLMKGAQLGASTNVIENAIPWIISENPGNIWLTVGHPDLVEKAMAKVDNAIDTTGLRNMIRSNSLRVKTQKTGDTNTTKEFPGGSFWLTSIGNHKAVRQVSMRYGFFDDFEALKGSSKESGATRNMIEKRFSAYKGKRKLFYISTPEVKQTSNIEPMFLEGDQRYYHVPCPCCGEFIVLEWEIEVDGKKAGITWKIDKKGLVDEESVGYTCQKCFGFFTDRHKYEMNLHGQWIPTATPKKKNHYSYHISSLYSAAGMNSWYDYVVEWNAAHPKDQPVDEGALQAFYNTTLGQTWEERGKAPSVNKISMNAGRYEAWTIPESISLKDGNGEIVMITLGADMNGVPEDARLDYEILAWSESGSTYSIAHGSIGTFIPRENTRKHKVDRERWTYDHGYPNSVWPEFEKIVKSQIKVLSENGERDMSILACGLDTGHYTAQAYQFVDSQNLLFFGLKGRDEDKYRRFGIDTPVFKQARERAKLFLVEVNQIKDDLADFMDLNWDESNGVDQPAGFMNFPYPSKDMYSMRDFFSHFEAEHRIFEKNAKGERTGARWVKKKATLQNHLFDCRVYNMAVKEILQNRILSEDGVPFKEQSWQAFSDYMLGK